ncbi:probable LRR receptor-like serine/threonine-protein kinase At3g47570 [Corylus avellana]|uniref:probable LRR receptor-like serine/threonine-protein kinase At3g47570 n=1 Tax=Corylus avellana TaxID=13451 RepID=UPI00286BFB8B|nr:probable LRR receptor-like serine/threonine-protein kinase At3g47570 [Corylus avellana]
MRLRTLSLYFVMLQEERSSNGEISTEDASWEHLEDPGGSKISSHQHNICNPEVVKNRQDVTISYCCKKAWDEIAHLQRLVYFGVVDNDMFGTFPYSFYNISSTLKRIEVAGNRLNGTLPANIGLTLSNLLSLNIAGNEFSGLIPVSLFNASQLEFIDLSFNNIVGQVPTDLGNLLNLSVLGVGGNNLGSNSVKDLDFLTSLENCTKLKRLGFFDNNFGGSLPDSIGNLSKQVRALHIDGNQISGIIPAALENLINLSLLNMHENLFTGPIPTNFGKFQKLQGLGLNGNRLRRKSKKESSSTLPKTNFLSNASYKELYQTTDGFSPSNLIGCGSFGSVYKGILAQEKRMVAVKILNLQQKGAFKSFMAECNVLRNIRHRNLVKILTCCSSMDYNGNEFKALVYEFMTNGNLDKWLHHDRDNESPPRYLNLLQRLNIVIDVAFALQYLHDHCETPIIHCDLKPSNVLLDDDMIAKVSDFGLARILSTTNDASQNQTSTVGIKGTIGFAAPEYGMGGEASAQGDVYSYGIFVLEMFTGKRPTDKLFKDGFNLHNFVNMALPEKLGQIVDPNLFKREVNELVVATEEDGYNNNDHNDIEAIEESVHIENLSQITSNVQKCLLSIFQISLACSLESPKERMNMGDVTRELHRIKNAFLEVASHG